MEPGHAKGAWKSHSALSNQGIPYPPTNQPTQLQGGVSSSSHSWSMLLLVANNDMNHQQKTMLFVINMIFNKWNNAPFLQQAFSLRPKEQPFKCSYPMSLYQYNLFI